MIISEPSYYKEFHCIASDCPDSCCKDWDVLVDPETVQKYNAVPGELGDRIRAAMKTEDGETYLDFPEGHCPLWREDGLCGIQAELGEDYLCRTCAEFPRIHHDYGDFMELGLELSCPEAARIILTAPAAQKISREVPGGTEPGYDEKDMALLKSTREKVLNLLENRNFPVGQVLQRMLLYAYDVDEKLNFPEDTPKPGNPEEIVLPEFPEMPGTVKDLFRFYGKLEILTEEWKQNLEKDPADLPWQDCFRNLARYFVDRYWLQAVSDGDLASRAKFIAVSCLMIRGVGGNVIRSAQLYSKEIENDGENMGKLLDAAFTEPEFRDAVLLRLLK